VACCVDHDRCFPVNATLDTESNIYQPSYLFSLIHTSAIAAQTGGRFVSGTDINKINKKNIDRSSGGGTSVPTYFNTPDDGRVGRNM
jgi:hypothetical protein